MKGCQKLRCSDKTEGKDVTSDSVVTGNSVGMLQVTV